MTTLRNLVGQLPKKELLQVLQDLEEGNLLRDVREALLPHQTKICPVCQNTVTQSVLTLTFGENIQKQASFCGKDCLVYFLQERK